MTASGTRVKSRGRISLAVKEELEDDIFFSTTSIASLSTAVGFSPESCCNATLIEFSKVEGGSGEGDDGDFYTMI